MHVRGPPGNPSAAYSKGAYLHQATVPCPGGRVTVLYLPRPLHHHPLIEYVQQPPHGRQVAVSDLLDDGDVIATQDLWTGPQWC